MKKDARKSIIDYMKNEAIEGNFLHRPKDLKNNLKMSEQIHYHLDELQGKLFSVEHSKEYFKNNIEKIIIRSFEKQGRELGNDFEIDEDDKGWLIVESGKKMYRIDKESLDVYFLEKRRVKKHETKRGKEGTYYYLEEFDETISKELSKYGMITSEKEEKLKKFFELEKKAKEAYSHLSRHDEDYEVVRDELINFVEYKDLYPIAYHCKPLVEYLEKFFSKFEAISKRDINRAPELTLYLEIWEKALEEKYEELLEDSNHTKILIDALDLLYDEFIYFVEILEEDKPEEIEIIENIVKQAKKIGVFKDENKEKFEQLLDKIENNEV